MDKLKKEQKMPSEPPGARIGHLHVKQIGTKKVNREEEKQAEHVGHFTGEVEDEYSYFLDTLKEEAAFGEEVGKEETNAIPDKKVHADTADAEPQVKDFGRARREIQTRTRWSVDEYTCYPPHWNNSRVPRHNRPTTSTAQGAQQQAGALS